VFDIEWLTQIFLWVVNFSYVLALLPQIILNYKIKSTNGLSDLYLVGYFSGYATNFFYVYAKNFHTAFKVRAILAVFVVSIMIVQRFFYNRSSVKTQTKKLYAVDFLFFLLLIPFVFKYPRIIGEVTGWALVFIWSFYQLPQVFKIYKTKSVEGFSFILVSLIGIGNLVELILAYIMNHPIQTYVIAIRGIIIYCIFCFQFWLYYKKSSNKVIEVSKNK